MVQTQAYERKTFVVEAVQVTLENFTEVIQWCGGTLRRDDLHRPYIAVEVRNPANPKQTMAYQGDWVLRASTGFRIYTDYAFHKSFVRTEKPLNYKSDKPDPYQLGNVFDRPDATPVVERPIGKEKEVQPESVEKVAIDLHVDSSVVGTGADFRSGEAQEVLIPEKDVQGRRQVEDLEYSHPGEQEGFVTRHLKEEGWFNARRPETDEQFGQRAADEFNKLARPATPFVRTPEEIREAHRTGGPLRELSPKGREAFRNLYGHYPEEGPVTGYVFSDGTPVLQEELEGKHPVASNGQISTYLENYHAEHGHYPGENVDGTDA